MKELGYWKTLANRNSGGSSELLAATSTMSSESSNTPSPKNNKIIIRHAGYVELHALSSVLAIAFQDEMLFGKLIHPYRDKYPSDVAYYWLRRFQRDYWDYSQILLAAVDTSVSPNRICGAAQWQRHGSGLHSRGWGLRKTDPRNLMYYVGAAQASVCRWLWPNRAADPEKEDVIERSEPFLDHVWVGPERGEGWYLNFLAVAPEYQGRGVGKRMVAWGLEQAEKEGVSASVIAAYSKDSFYQTCGFDTMVGRAGDGEGNPLASVPGGNIWFKFFPKRYTRAQAEA